MNHNLEKSKYDNKQKGLYREELNGTLWLGVVVDGDDPDKRGAAKVLVFEKFDAMDEADLPWALPDNNPFFGGGGGAGSFSYPKKGTLVNVTFDQGDINHPKFYSCENLNKEMMDTIAKDYVNAHVILWDQDEHLRIYYTKSGGFTIDLKGTIFNIQPNNNFSFGHNGGKSGSTYKDGHVQTTSQGSIIEKSPVFHADSPDTKLGPSGHEPATRCGALMDLLGEMAKAIVKGGGPPSILGKVASMQGTICSSTVTIAS